MLTVQVYLIKRSAKERDIIAGKALALVQSPAPHIVSYIPVGVVPQHKAKNSALCAPIPKQETKQEEQGTR